MPTPSLANLSPAERAATQAKAQAARAANTAARRTSGLRRDFLDAPEWDRLAHQYGVRLPPWGQAASGSTVRRLCKLLGRELADYVAHVNEKSADAAAARSGLPARAVGGLMIEWHDTDRRRAARAAEGRTISGHLLTCLEPHGGPCRAVAP